MRLGLIRLYAKVEESPGTNLNVGSEAIQDRTKTGASDTRMFERSGTSAYLCAEDETGEKQFAAQIRCWSLVTQVESRAISAPFPPFPFSLLDESTSHRRVCLTTSCCGMSCMSFECLVSPLFLAPAQPRCRSTSSHEPISAEALTPAPFGPHTFLLDVASDHNQRRVNGI